MRGLKTLGIGLALLIVVVGVPVAALAVDFMVGHDRTASAVSMDGTQHGTMGSMMKPNQSTNTAAADLTIVHAQKGCHLWAEGSSQMPMMRLTLKVGQMLQIMNQDVDMHRMMELAGPRIMLGGAMKQGQTQTLTFAKPGTYRFMTKVSPMAGMPEVATTGPDNTLRLTVKVV
jgi:plastocyanin